MDASDVRNLEPFTIVKKPHSMTSLYLDPTNVKQNVDASVKIYFVPEIIGNVETSENTNKPRYVTTLSKSSMIVAERDNVDKNIRVLISQVLGIEPKTGIVPYISTSLGQTDNPTKTPLDKSDGNVSTQSPEKSEEKDDSDGTFGDLSDKEENSVEKKDQSTDIENIDDLDSDDEPIGKILSPGISKRLKRRKGKAVESSSKPSKSLKRSTSVGPTKGWSKVVNPVTKKRYLKRKEASSASKKWNFVYQRTLALERELGKYSFECKEVMGMIQEAGLMKSVTSFGKCYEILVKEFIVNISKECDNKRSKEFRKVYVRGTCVEFSPEIINRFLGRSEEEQAEVEVSDNVICIEIIAKQVKE
ncbi:uncharacterized protein LOC127080367 [Lathyrus oleraceus]|uniref:uncharacterized protein LOC127080367 n=1 Tax=Pisum sativum TaxID=3888 RepID=UPI0021D28538|nr:uncharacterized protein LOC127080367 [Pisum sativum]